MNYFGFSLHEKSEDFNYTPSECESDTFCYLVSGDALNYWLHAYSAQTVVLKNKHKCSLHRTHLAQVPATYWRQRQPKSLSPLTQNI